MDHVKFVQHWSSKHLHVIGIDCSISATAYQQQESICHYHLLLQVTHGIGEYFSLISVLSYAFLGKQVLFIAYKNRTKHWRGQC